MSRSAVIERFLSTGIEPTDWSAWSGDAAAGRRTLVRILQRILTHRAGGAPLGLRPVPANAGRVLVDRASSMLEGLLGVEEARQLKIVLPGRVRVVTVDNFETQVTGLSLDDAWCLANIVLEDMGAPPLSDGAPQLDGLCVADHVWVPPGAFARRSPTVDVLVHEVAHLLHTVARPTLGLSGEGPVLVLRPERHETFAYACELWACREDASVPRASIEDSLQDIVYADARVDRAELSHVLQRAERAGWAALRELVG